MSWLKRRGRIGHRLNRFNQYPVSSRPSYWLPHDASYWLPPALCAASALLARRFIIRPAHPSRPSAPPCVPCLASPYLVSPFRPVVLIRRACPCRPIRSSCLFSSCRLASLYLLSPPIVSPGGAFCVSLSSRHASRYHLVMRSVCRLCVLACRHAFRSSSSRRAYRYTECCGDGDRRMWGIRASAPISCTSFLWASCVSLLQHGVPFFFLLFRFLSSCLPVPRVDKRGDVWRFSR